MCGGYLDRDNERLAPRTVQVRGGNPFANVPEAVAERIAEYLPPLRVVSPRKLEEWIQGCPLRHINAVLNLSSRDKENEQAYVALFKRTSVIKLVHLDISGGAFVGLIGALVSNRMVERVFINTRRATGDDLISIAHTCRNTKVKLGCSFQLDPSTWTEKLASLEITSIMSALDGCREQLAYLRTQHVPLHLSGIDTVPYITAAFNNLESLSLVDSNLHPGNLEEVLTFVKASERLNDLNLSENPLGDKSMKMLGHFLKTNLRVERLGLQNVEIGPTGAIDLIKSLPESNLKSLFLKDDDIEDAGGLALAEMLKKNPPLEALYCSYAGLKEVSAAALIDALRVNTKLEELNLCNNGFSPQGTKQLRDAANNSTTLHHLMLNDDCTDIHKRPVKSFPRTSAGKAFAPLPVRTH